METQLFDFIYPSFRSILMNWISNERRTKHSTPRKLRDLGIVISELQHCAPDQISISSSDARSMTNILKGKLEDLTGQVWDWWPLEPYMRGLAKDEVRLHWRCVSFSPDSRLQKLLKVELLDLWQCPLGRGSYIFCENSYKCHNDPCSFQ